MALTGRTVPEAEALLAPEGARGDQRLDTVGLYCPIPIIRTAERVRAMTSGQVLEVLSDDRVILIDMPAWCRSTGHGYIGYLPGEEGEWRLFVRVR